MHSGSESKRTARAALQALNRALAAVDRLAALPCDDQPAPLFVVGLPRSGTTLAYELIVQAFDVAFLTKISNYLYGLPNLTTRIVSSRTRMPSPVYRSSYGRIPGRFAPAENSNLWLRWFPQSEHLGHYVPPGMVRPESRADATRSIGSMTAIAKRPFVFKNVYMTLSLAAVMQTFESARTIIVERDINAVAASILAARQSQSGDNWWSIRPPLYTSVLDEHAERQVAFQCVRTTQLLDQQLDQIHPSRFLKVDYRELCRSPNDVLTRIHEWAAPRLAYRQGFSTPGPFRESRATRLSTSFDAAVAEYVDDRGRYLSEVDSLVDEISSSVSRAST